MKPAQLLPITCPHCRQDHLVISHELEDFYEGHVVRCPAQMAGRFSAQIVAAGINSAIEQVTFTGRLFLRLFDASGDLKDFRLVANLVVDAGKALIIDRLQGVGGPPAVPDYQAVGTGSTAANAADTALGTEIGTRVQGALTQPTALTDRLVSTFVAGNGTGTITESGRLNAAAAGTLLARQVFGAITKGASDSLAITHDILIS